MLLICNVTVLFYAIVVYTERLEPSITNLKEESLSTHQQQHLFVPIKGTEMEMQDLLNKPSIIPSGEVHYIVFFSVFIFNITPLSRRTLVYMMFRKLTLRMRHHLSL